MQEAILLSYDKDTMNQRGPLQTFSVKVIKDFFLNHIF